MKYEGLMWIIVSCVLVGMLLLFVFLLVRHQCRLWQRARLIQEAIENGDFQFRLPTRGLLWGDRAVLELQNDLGELIRRQRRQSEQESWEQLIRVLTHEIMNATAPIVSISQTLLAKVDGEGTSVEKGIRAIHHTAEHLSTFVASYRKFSLLQHPVPRPVRLSGAVEALREMYPDVECESDVEDGIVVNTDPDLLRQVLMNLVKNAVEAGAKRIRCKAGTLRRTDRGDRACVTLTLANDGAPIPADARSSIFVPFFTTKRDGSGIGLFLSRKIMMQQGGDLELMDDAQTTFRLTFAPDARGTAPRI